ncbi:MAG: UDP-N-acetylmuramoyl-tripeptide--D-alanyl-D-alanine ligase, partial [Candidatus Melainabacteria bacterium]|nr:UDP-N-acetylmuramoyl-tripeptide--D-alanyl-D-alanine ligase [Candidatus Melainabacteria bacterium]
MAEFDFSQVVKWLGCSNQVSGKVRGFKQNSLEVVPGDLFFAMKGETVDGHAYLKGVAVQGAVGAVVSNAYDGDNFGLELLRVQDVRDSLQNLARIVHSMRKVRVVAVTGSVGKTTTKEFVATLLEGKFHVAKTPGNANSQVGVPLSILNSAGDEEVFVMEMGMSAPHEIERLVAVAPPEVALITKIALAHAAFFPEGIHGIAGAKAEILSHPNTRIGILNAQVAEFPVARQTGLCRKMTYGFENSDFVLVPEGEGFFIREGMDRSPVFTLPFTASHLCENFLGAAAVARAMGMQWEEILPQAQKLKSFKRRFERVEHAGIVFINDSYNANLTSMTAALTNLPAPNGGGKTIAVLGAMKELGEHTEQCHYEVAKIALSHVDYLLCLGEECVTMVDLFQKEGKPVEHFLDLDTIKQRVFEL